MTTRERPILFSGAMVRAILDGRKSQTRRVVKPQPSGDHGLQPMWGKSPDTPPVAFGTPYLWREVGPDYPDDEGDDRRCPFGQPGDRLWVRESCIISPKRFDGARSDSYNVFDGDGDGRICQYIASTPDTDAAHDYGLKVTPSIHMPRWASRIMLEITGLRVERIQSIPFFDIRAEGVGCPTHDFPGGFCCSECADMRDYWSRRWNVLNAKRGYGWDANPWVWVIEFKRVDAEAQAAA